VATVPPAFERAATLKSIPFIAELAYSPSRHYGTTTIAPAIYNWLQLSVNTAPTPTTTHYTARRQTSTIHGRRDELLIWKFWRLSISRHYERIRAILWARRYTRARLAPRVAAHLYRCAASAPLSQPIHATAIGVRSRDASISDGVAE